MVEEAEMAVVVEDDKDNLCNDVQARDTKNILFARMNKKTLNVWKVGLMSLQRNFSVHFLMELLHSPSIPKILHGTS